MATTLRRVIIWVAVFAERWVLPLVFFRLAWVELLKTHAIYSGQYPIQTTLFVDVGHHLILLVLACLTGIMLLVARRPLVSVQKLRFVIVPLATTFFTVFYYTAPFFPAAMRANLCPLGLREGFVAMGLACVVVGPLFALWGILHLRRSFGIFVAVRRIVLTGPYQWVRHPMYLGWVLICGGVALANFSVAYFFLTGMHMLLLMYRAHLEEIELAEHSSEYREYRKRTGFIFPRLDAKMG